MQNNVTEDFLKKLISENESKNNSEEDDENKYKMLFSFEEYLEKKIKLDISYIQYNENKHIVLSLRRYKKDLFKWEYQGKIITTIEILEKIVGKAREIWISKDK
jgi:hypothetical protein